MPRPTSRSAAGRRAAGWPAAALALLTALALGCTPTVGGSAGGGAGGAGGTGGKPADARPPGTGGTGGGGSGGAGGSSGGSGGSVGPADSGPMPGDASLPDAGPGNDSAPSVDTAPADAAGDSPPAAGAWARQLRLGLVEVSQSVFIKLGEGDTTVAPAMRNAEVIEGRAMMVRVHIRPEAGFTARMLRAVLTLSYPMATPPAPDAAFEETKLLSGASDPEKMETTFNFLVPAAAVKPGARLVAAVYEAGAGINMGPDPAMPPRFPATGAADLAVRAGRMVLDVTLVPAIGVGGMVDSSPARRKRLEDHLFDVYPVQKAIVRWREPLRFTTRINASAGFQALQMARTRDNASAGTYYHLLLAKEDSTEAYLGIANLAGASMNDGPRRIGITFVTGRAVDSLLDTVSHEMGHNHGRNHAPGCNAAGVDMGFPYVPGPGIGVNGFSLSEMKLKTVRMHKDLMGYCNVTWVSDYTWKGFAGRVRAVSAFVPPDGTMAYSPPPAGRTLIGYQSPDDAEPRWTVVPGRLAEGPDGVAQVRLMSDDRTREITVNLPDKPGATPLRSIDVPMPEGGVQRFDLPAPALTLPSQ
jgi:hypothetical protein